MVTLPKLKERFSKERFAAGLDIGAHTVKFVKLKFLKDQVELAGFELEPAQFNLQKLQDIQVVNMAVSGPATIIRYVNFPRMNEDELKRSLRFEAQKHIPFSVEEVNLDSYVLKEDLPDNKMLVLLAAVKKEIVSQRLKLIEDAGLKVNLIDVDSVALVNAFNFNYPKDDKREHRTIALLNIGALMSNLNILEDGIPCLSRDIHLAGNSFTQKLADIFGIDFKAAEDLKLNPDKERAQKINAAVESVLTNLAAEIRTSFDYYESQSASTVAKIFLSGGSVLFAGIKDMLVNLLGIEEAEFWDPLKQINIPSGIDSGRAKAKSAQLAVAVGLALRG